MKRCPKCRTEKPEAEFAIDSSRKDGLKVYCRGCDRARRTATTKGQPVTLTETAAVWATKKLNGQQSYWQQMGEWMMGDVDARPVD